MELLRKKEEQRKQTQIENYKKKIDEENRKAEELEKKRQEKDEERKKALEMWHKNKVRSIDSVGKSLSIVKKKKFNKIDTFLD